MLPGGRWAAGSGGGLLVREVGCWFWRWAGGLVGRWARGLLGRRRGGGDYVDVHVDCDCIYSASIRSGHHITYMNAIR